MLLCKSKSWYSNNCLHFSKHAASLKDPLEVVNNIQFLIATTQIEYDAVGVVETFSNEYFSASLTGLSAFLVCFPFYSAGALTFVRTTVDRIMLGRLSFRGLLLSKLC
jgi:hypothetical protein